METDGHQSVMKFWVFNPYQISHMNRFGNYSLDSAATRILSISLPETTPVRTVAENGYDAGFES